MAKAPQPGVTKTRLCPPLTADEAARLAGAFIRDTILTVARADICPRIMCRGAAEQEALRELVGDATSVSMQRGVGLGDALEGAFREGLEDGFAAVAVVGADSPTLPDDILREAFRAVASGNDVVLGPAEDGGYYLLAASAVHPALFRDMRWSTADVAQETLRRSRALGLRTHVLPGWYDVDDSRSLGVLRAELRRLPIGVARHTRAVVSTFDESCFDRGRAA
jgi:rSAM/selenodomain-associated transferase 1